MNREIEKKYRLTNEQREHVLESLKEFGAVFEGEDFEENILFWNEMFEEKPIALRLRKIGERTILTYKQRLPSKFAVKEQIEYETEVADFEAIQNIILSLGFTPSLVYEKRRQTFKFRQVEIVLDELPFGQFMEIEGTFTDIAEAEMILDLEDFEAELETYPNLTMQLGKKEGEMTVARFHKKENSNEN